MIEAICPDCGENMDPVVFVEKQICSECGCDLSSNTKLYNRIKRKIDEAGAVASSGKTPAPTPSANDAVSKSPVGSRSTVSSLYQKNASMSTTGRVVNANTSVAKTAENPLLKPETNIKKTSIPIPSPKQVEHQIKEKNANEVTAQQNNKEEKKQISESIKIPSSDIETSSIFSEINPESALEYEEETGTSEDITDNFASNIDNDEHEKDTLDDTIQAIPKKKKPSIEIPGSKSKDGFERSFMPGKKLSFVAKIKENVYDSLPLLRKMPKTASCHIGEPDNENKVSKPHGKVKLKLECDCNYSSNTDGYYNDVFFDNKPGADLIPIGTITKVCATLMGLFLLEVFFIYYV